MENWTWVFDLVSSLATAGAVVVALFLPYFHRPKLEIFQNSQNSLGEYSWTPNDAGVIDHENRWYHIRVRNNGPVPAAGTRIYITRVEERDDRNQWSVVWEDEIALSWRSATKTSDDNDSIRVRTIGKPASADLLSIKKKADSLRLRMGVVHSGMGLRVSYDQAVDLRLRVQAWSHLGGSKPELIEVLWDGKWATDDQEMAKHLTVKLLRGDARRRALG